MSKDLQDQGVPASPGILGLGGGACPRLWPCLDALAQAPNSGAVDFRKRRRSPLKKLQGMFAWSSFYLL